ncbi:MAG: hypothetical protein KDB03_15035 [Planctomycetales bacterium]|nr:hypothetical protein [Planctomycetales bacterium]
MIEGIEGYRCVTFEEIGLSIDSHIASITSSCECIEPRIVEFNTVHGGTSNGIFLRFASNGKETHIERVHKVAADLAVLIELTLVDGTTHQFTVRLLQTSLI